MATGRQMLAAVLDAIKQPPKLKELRLSVFDAYDLFKLRPGDLQEFGADCQRAEAISSDLLNGSLAELSAWLDITLVKDKQKKKNLIPGEGFRRTAGIWATGNDNPDSMVEEIHRLRNPEAR
jgi:hypothetical protein